LVLNTSNQDGRVYRQLPNGGQTSGKTLGLVVSALTELFRGDGHGDETCLGVWWSKPARSGLSQGIGQLRLVAVLEVVEECSGGTCAKVQGRAKRSNQYRRWPGGQRPPRESIVALGTPMGVRWQREEAACGARIRKQD
jgi:hypothetical protein